MLYLQADELLQITKAAAGLLLEDAPSPGVPSSGDYAFEQILSRLIFASATSQSQMHDTPSEAELVVRMRAGDERAFDRFFSGYLPRLYRFVLPRVSRREEVAEDVCQAVLSRAVQSIGNYRGEASLFTWLCQMARNEIADLWRKEKRRGRVEVLAEDDPLVAATLESLEGDPSWRPDTQGSRQDVSRLVQVALDSLPGTYGNALEWKYLDGFSVAEIAAKLGQNVISTQSMLARARSAFREAFEAVAGPEAARELRIGDGGMP
jgi:RNA polymerase sigma-70 factor (ECF subfamily)